MHWGQCFLGVLLACLVAMATADPKPLDVGGAYHEVEAHNIRPAHTGPNLGGTNGGGGNIAGEVCGLSSGKHAADRGVERVTRQC
jgi:hypothetical protein